MPRLLLLAILAMWLIASGQPNSAPARPSTPALAWFFTGFLALVAIVALWARLARHGITTDQTRSATRRLQRGMRLSRWAILLWFAFGVFGPPQWASVVTSALPHHAHTLALLIGIAPVLVTCILLWWAEYPYDLAVREQMAFAEWWAADLPIHAPLTLPRRIALGIRQNLLSVLAPVTIAMLLRDCIILAAAQAGWRIADDLALLPSAAIAYILAPPLLCWLYGAVPLNDPDLLPRLHAICARHGLGCRHILYWPTGQTHANAQVVGLFPRFRYVFLSDRLLETMSDEQIEACFAHEVGHVVHRHLAWMVAFTIAVMLATVAAGQWLGRTIDQSDWLTPQQASYAALAYSALSFGITLYLLGALMRRFERQADVFAARSLEHPSAITPSAVPVGPRGAAILGSALDRVAFVNGIPPDQRDLFHPSITRRIALLQELSADAALTGAFDARMTRLYGTILLALAAFTALLVTGP